LTITYLVFYVYTHNGDASPQSSPIGMMPTSCVLLYCVQHSQVFLQPQLVPHKQNTFCLSYYNNFVTVPTLQRTFSTPIITRTIRLVVI